MTDTSLKKDTEPELDEELLEEAIRQVGAQSRNEALNIALRELVVAKRAIRRQALEEVRRMSREGAFNYELLEELDR